jgi:hypothetical protein
MAQNYLSHTTQLLQNYFDPVNIRTRRSKYCIDAQLLNVSASVLDDFNLRFSRELGALTLQTAPTNLDNLGVYYSCQLSNNYVIPSGATSLTTVQGTINNETYTLTPFDDRLPVPYTYNTDSNRDIVPFTSPIITTLTGSGSLTTNFYWDIQAYNGPYTFPIPNKLSLWLSNSGSDYITITVTVQGYKYPKSVWAKGAQPTTEVITISNEGYSRSFNLWSEIDSVTVRGLPSGAVLTLYSMDFQLPAIPDQARPYTDPTFRGITFPRYWQLPNSQGLMTEVYQLDNISGYRVQQNYYTVASYEAGVVEPNTNGMLLGAGTTLAYLDRREPLPSNLRAPAISQEPLYGVTAVYNETVSPGRYITITPVPYGNSGNIQSYRYTLQLPSGTKYLLFYTGDLAPYTTAGGWNGGAPPVVQVQLNVLGTYIITLQCADINGNVTHDSFPYYNGAVTDLIQQTYDLSDIIDNISGIAYDGFNNLWLWNGNYAVPIVPIYHGYILDPINGVLYLTDNWSSIQYE